MIHVADKTRLHEKYPTLFSIVQYGVDILTKQVLITSAEMLAIYTTEKTLIAAPGAGYFIDVLSISEFLDYNTTAYTTNTTLEYRYTNKSGAKVTVDSPNLLAATADKVITVKADDAEVVNAINAPVVATTATGNPAAGDSPVYVTVTYRVMKAA